MGLCSSTDPMTPEQAAANAAAKQRSKEVDRELAKQDSTNKLLLLGAGDSGKSTLFKQMKTIYGTGFSEKERKTYISTIFNNIIISIKTLTEQSSQYGEIANQDAKTAIMELKEDTAIDAATAQWIAILWGEKAVQLAYQHRSTFQLTDSTAYYFGRLGDVIKHDYTPTEQDVLRTRVPTTGIIENSFEIDGNLFKIMDVGGQRSERKKWIHCFEGVTAVLFVAAISSYDQVLYEDTATSQMAEALALYEDVANNQWFADTALILFLNKKDLFAEKIQQVPLSAYFSDYTGTTYEEGIEYMKSLFKNRNHSKTKDVYIHVTCATDKNQIQQVFADVKDIVIKKVLKVLM